MSEKTLTVQDFYKSLNEKVSGYDATLILNSALAPFGMHSEQEASLTSEQANDICLELIKKGGPAFQVGKSIYTDLNPKI